MTPSWLRDAAAALSAAGVTRPRWTAEQIAASVLDCEPLALTLDPPVVGPSEIAQVRRRIARRVRGVPLQYLTGICGFFGNDLRVGDGVFIPRPETERLVEVAVRELARLPVTRPTVFDVGTGSGAVAISLTFASPIGTLVGFDISRQALTVAQGNAHRLGIAARIRWVCADLLTPCGSATADLVVANLPYIPSSALPSLPPEVQWEPPLALDGGADGLRPCRRLLAQAQTRLRPHGVMVLEVGVGQAARLRAEYAGRWAQIDVIQDDTGAERVVVFHRRRPAHPDDDGSRRVDAWAMTSHG